MIQISSDCYSSGLDAMLELSVAAMCDYQVPPIRFN